MEAGFFSPPCSSEIGADKVSKHKDTMGFVTSHKQRTLRSATADVPYGASYYFLFSSLFPQLSFALKSLFKKLLP